MCTDNYIPMTSPVQIHISVTLTNTEGFPIDKKVSYHLCIDKWEKYLAQQKTIGKKSMR